MLEGIRRKVLLVETKMLQKASRLLKRWYDPRIERLAQIEKVREALELEEEQRFLRQIEGDRQALKLSERLKGRVVKDYMVWKATVLRNLKDEIGRCEKCQRTDIPLTIDHIIPQLMMRDLGINPEEDRDTRNFRLLCKLCNSLKAHHLDFTDERTKPLLLEFLSKFPGTETYPEQKQRDIIGRSYPADLPSWFRRQYDRIHR